MCNSALPFPFFFDITACSGYIQPKHTVLCTSDSIFTPPSSSAAGSVVFDAVCKLQKQAPLVAQSQHFPKPCLRLLWPLCLRQADTLAQPWSQGCPTALLPSSCVSLVSLVPSIPAPSAWESPAPFADKSPPWNNCASAGLGSSPLQMEAGSPLCHCCAEGKAGLAETSDAF